MAFWIMGGGAVAILYWIYDGYGRFLQVVAAVAGVRIGGSSCVPSNGAGQSGTDRGDACEWPEITVLLTVHNEEKVIRQKLENLLACEYPAGRCSVVVASDGSTDSTNAIVREYSLKGVRLFESPGLGKTATQNAAIETIQTELIAFTDADIQFCKEWLYLVVEHFRDPAIGAVDGRYLFGNEDAQDLHACQGYYWRYELKLRTLESGLGLLAVVAGACFAMRRSLFVPMDPSIGEDCIVPLDVVSQGYRVVHEPRAIGIVDLEDDTGVSLRRRIRMTLRNWQGTWTRSHLLNPLRHPGYAFALWSHKLLRWLSPVFLVLATLSFGALLVVRPSLVTAVAFCPFAGLYLLALYHMMLNGRGLRLPGTAFAYSFLLANLAFIIGVWRAMTGHQVRQYRNT